MSGEREGRDWRRWVLWSLQGWLDLQSALLCRRAGSRGMFRQRAFAITSLPEIYRRRSTSNMEIRDTGPTGLDRHGDVNSLPG